MLDNANFTLGLAIVTAGSSIGLLLSALTQNFIPAARMWALASLLVSLYFPLILWQNIVPFGISIGLAHIFLSLGCACALAGMDQWNDRPMRLGIIAFCMVIWWVPTAYFLWIAPSTSSRVIFSSAPFGILQGLIALSCWQARGRAGGPAMRLLAAAFLAGAVGTLGRVPVLLITGEQFDSVTAPSSTMAASLVIYLFQITMVSVGFQWALSLRLNNELSVLNRRLLLDATHDGLTEIANRRGYSRRAEQLLAAYTRHKRIFSLILLDVDHFKSVNDLYGHTAGDHVLRQLAGTLSSGIRSEDTVARMGGEEFAILLPETGIDLALSSAERLRASIAEMSIDCGGQMVRITASFGATEIRPDDTLDSLHQRADNALYAAKNAGRNTVRGA